MQGLRNTKRTEATLKNKMKYYNTLSKYRRLCRQKQRKHERDQTEAMGNETEMSKYLNKILKNKAKKDIGTLKKNNGDYTTPSLNTLEELASKHYPTHTGKKDTVYPEVSITKAGLDTRYNDWINEEKSVALVAQGVSTRRTGHILEALLPQGELRE